MSPPYPVKIWALRLPAVIARERALAHSEAEAHQAQKKNDANTEKSGDSPVTTQRVPPG